MGSQQQDPSRILEEARQQLARQHLEALKQAGVTREDILALLQEDSRAQQSQPQQQGGGPEATPVTSPGLQAPPSFGSHFVPSHQIRSSVSSTASGSSVGESILSQATTRSSVSSIASGRSSTPSNATEAKYWCTSCDKTFKRKFDWKRHEEEFHERWRKYPCPSCNQSFWGPNTFNQHHKSAHGCKTCPHSDAVVKYMRKRRAWGCGFCAAMHTKLEKHYEHVAAHFESGSAKQDWLHSNVIYGLLHQPAVLEAWKELLSRKQDRFSGHQPMFSWNPDNTARAQGYVENENPGQLQDFLEFFDGSKESAEKVARCAWGYVHVVLKPKPSGEAAVPQNTHMTMADESCRLQSHVSITSQSKGMRTVSATTLMPISRQPSRPSPQAEFQEQHIQTPVLQVSSPESQHSHEFPNFLPPQQLHSQPMPQEPMHMNQRPLSLNKALPPAPLVPSPMEIDFPPHPQIYSGSPDPMLKPPNMMEDWQSLTSTLIDDQTMSGTHQQGFPMTWNDLGQFGVQPHQ